jgi:hypothetical protein
MAEEATVGIKRKRPARELHTERIVGVCGSCLGDVVFDAAVREAKCPCGVTCIPRAYMIAGVYPKR